MKKHKIMLLHIIILISSLVVSFVMTLYLRQPIYKRFNFLIRFIKKEKSIITIDSDGIPKVDYGYRNNIKIGIQRNPVTVCKKASEYYKNYISTNNEKYKGLFLNNVNWLLNNTVHKNGFSTFEYEFPLPIYNLEPPWSSAMANGQSLEVFCKAHKLTENGKYLDNADQILNSFFVSVEDGGITYKDKTDSWWYEEYVSYNKGTKESRVLNGMLFTLVGIHEYYKYTNNDDAKILFDKGVNNVVENLCKYDNNGNSYYDVFYNPAQKYHKIHVNLLNQLYSITGQEIFKKYSDKWNNFTRDSIVENKKFKHNLISVYRKKKNLFFNILLFFIIFLILEICFFIRI